MSSENLINVQFTSCVQGVLRKPFITKCKSKYFRPLKTWDLFTFITEILHEKFQFFAHVCYERLIKLFEPFQHDVKNAWAYITKIL